MTNNEQTVTSVN